MWDFMAESFRSDLDCVPQVTLILDFNMICDLYPPFQFYQQKQNKILFRWLFVVKIFIFMFLFGFFFCVWIIHFKTFTNLYFFWLYLNHDCDVCNLFDETCELLVGLEKFELGSMWNVHRDLHQRIDIIGDRREDE